MGTIPPDVYLRMLEQIANRIALAKQEVKDLQQEYDDLLREATKREAA